MRPIEIEAWVLRIVDQCKQKQHCEDSYVELKSEWIPPETAARQIAAHANASRGHPVLWIVGLDEKRGILGADPQELSNWFSAVRARFNLVWPSLTDLNVNAGGKMVVALLFSTDRAPYLVQNPSFGSQGGGPVEWEVPWREGRKTRTAVREDLVRMLFPLANAPNIEGYAMSLSVHPGRAPQSFTWQLNAFYYLVPATDRRVVLPTRDCEVMLIFPSGYDLNTRGQLELLAPQRATIDSSSKRSHVLAPDSETITSTSTELLVSGPGMAIVKWRAEDLPMPVPTDSHVTVATKFRVAGMESAISYQAQLERMDLGDTLNPLVQWNLPLPD